MMKGGMGNLMKQAQQMQANMAKAQEELANIDVEGIAANGHQNGCFLGKRSLGEITHGDNKTHCQEPHRCKDQDR